MRYLLYKGFILENSAIWEAAKKSRNDPARASLLQIGYRYLCDNPNQNMAYRQKKTWIHPLLRVVLDFAGHSYITWGLCVLAKICDAAYCLYCAVTYDGYFYAAVSFVMCLFNLIVYAIVNSVEAKAYNRVMDYSDLDLKGANKPHNMSEATFLMLMGRLRRLARTAIVILIQLALLGIGIIQAQNITNGEQYCIPYWVFLSELQPLLSIMVMTHGFVRLNLFMERDVEQDITELALSMSYLKGKKGGKEGGKEGEDDDHKIDNIIQQLRLLERLDSRPCVLNFDFVPTMESSRALISFVFTGIGLLGPYILVALGSSTSDGYMSLD